MATPLIHLLQRSQEDWLIGYSTQKLIHLTQAHYQEITPQTQTILLAERDPICFLAGFIAACSTNAQIFLCNPDWVQQEWQQVFALVQPDLIWGDVAKHWRVDRQTNQKTNGLGEKFVPFTNQSSPKSAAQFATIMIPTGGTSGKIRFAMHTWSTLTASAQGFKTYFEVDRVHSCCVLPLYHVSGLMQFMRSFTSGGKLAILPWRAIATQATSAIDPQEFFLSLVPTQLQQLLLVAPLLAQFRTILLGGAPAWPELLKEAQALQLAIAPTYGMTETASQIATLKPEDFLREQYNCGLPLPHAQITIRSTTGQILEAGQIGRIIIQSDSLMLGYYPHLLNRSTYEPDDLGFLDSQGYLHIVGRNSNKIITGGENVFPSEVEAAIFATKMVRDVCVVGISDPIWGQIVAAVYVSNPIVPSEKLASALEGKLSKFKHPKCWVAIAALPRTAHGKINLDQLRQIIATKTDRPTTLAKA
ncbi:MAG: 2-succinylbenzoate--CoA ligase [Leptolyngbyaceae cyanobacterium CSU_1_3]|nr:2-succinylbenzoate--CoA ligase [Leptolyngbyaceae cyanobacterium CSU_1_3]